MANDQFPELVSLGGLVRREVALVSLLPGEAALPELVVMASGIGAVDVVAGTALRSRIERHRARQPTGTVAIMPPTSAAVAQRLLELLGPLPEFVSVTTGALPDDVARYALMPATPIADAERARLAAEFAVDACDRARIAEARSNAVGLAVMELADNALRHAGTLEVPPVVAVTVSGRERRIEVAATDLGTRISEAQSPRSLLGAIPGTNGGVSGLSDLVRHGAKHRFPVSIEILSGTGRLRWTPTQHRAETRQEVAGTTFVVRIDS